MFFQQQFEYDLIKNIPVQIEKFFEMQNYELESDMLTSKKIQQAFESSKSGSTEESKDTKSTRPENPNNDYESSSSSSSSDSEEQKEPEKPEEPIESKIEQPKPKPDLNLEQNEKAW